MNNDGNNAVDAVELEENDAWLIAEIEGNLVGSDGGAPAEDVENFSFEDSERFEDESLCSLPSENGSLNHKWRGWASRQLGSADQPGPSGLNPNAPIAASGLETASIVKSFDDLSIGPGIGRTFPSKRETKHSPAAGQSLRRLEDLAARKVAHSMSFEAIESLYWKFTSTKIPECLFLPVLRCCFPESENDIRLYSCLANTHANQFSDGDRLYKTGAVGEIYQIGYLVQARVNATSVGPSSHQHNVSIRVDKCRVVACECSCSALASWCQHVVAVCLKRLHQPAGVQYRMTVWDSITSLGDMEVKKLAQYLINELPPEYLTTAQKIIDSLKILDSEINRSMGAPDPTADCQNGGVASWYMNEKIIHDNIHKILINFVRPAPTVHCDILLFSSSCPPASSEWSILIRPLRSREPEALWNLLAIVREQLRRGDENAGALLHIITVNCLRLEPLVVWWYQTALAASGRWIAGGNGAGGNGANGKAPPAGQQQAHAAQRNAAVLCDEIVALWRLVALNPRLTADERYQLASLLQLYHRSTVDLIWKRIESVASGHTDSRNFFHFALHVTEAETGASLGLQNASFAMRLFPGFFAALQACHLDWQRSDFGRAVRDLGLARLQADIQRSSMVGPALADRYRNIPLLLIGAETLAAELADSEHTVTTTAAAVGGSGIPSDGDLVFLLPKSSRSRRKKSATQSRRSHRNRNHQHNNKNINNNSVNYNNINNNNRHQQHMQVAASAAAAAADSSDSMVEDAEEEFENGPSCSNQLPKSLGKKTKPTVAKPPYEPDLQTLFAQAHDELKYGFTARFTCCEALLGYGYTAEAFTLAGRLAEELLDNLPDLFLDETPVKTADLSPAVKFSASRPTRRVGGGASDARVDASRRTVDALSVTLFLIRVLAGGGGGAPSIALALKLGIRTLRNPRGPTATKSLEVHIYHLEQELLKLLRQLPVSGGEERELVRQQALDHLCALRCDGAPAAHLIVVPPFSLALYVLDALGGRRWLPAVVDDDESLALAVALETLGARCAVLETDHPMLCECIRRQRGELAMTLLLRNRDSVERLAVILDKVLDSAVHQMYSSTTSNASFFFKQLNPNHIRYRLTGLVGDILASNFHTGFATNFPPSQQFTNTVKASRQAAKSASVSSGEISSNDAAASGSVPLLNCVSESSTESLLLGASVMEPPSQIFSNLATEAQAHFMVELAKRLLTEAGGNQSHTMFISRGGGHAAAGGGAPNAAGGGVPHRNLHICAFLTGLYALGLNNLVSATWPTRTYSTHACWIQVQAMEIGRTALQIVRETWEAHLTPTEVATLADKASQSADPAVVEEGAQLALTVLPRAYALTAIESQKALNQCKEQSAELLERACEAVERAAEKDGVYPEVLFKVAHHWYNLHIESSPTMSTWNATPASSLPASGSVGRHFKQPPPAGIDSTSHGPTAPTSPQLALAAQTQAMIDQIVQQHQLRGSSQQQQQQQQQYHQQQQQYLQNHQQQQYPQKQQIGYGPGPYTENVYNVPYGPPANTTGGSCVCQPHEMAGGSAARLHVSHSAPNLQPTGGACNFPPPLPLPPPHPSQIMTLPAGLPSMPMAMPPQANYGNWNPAAAAYGHTGPYYGGHGGYGPSVPGRACKVHVPPQGINVGHMVTPVTVPLPPHYSNGQQRYGNQLPVYAIPPLAICQYGGQMPSYCNQFPHLSAMAYGNQLGRNMAAPPPSLVQPKILPAPPVPKPLQSRFLINAHRVGMRAMDTMGQRHSDDTRSFAKYSRTPAFGDDIRWLFEEVSMKLGDAYVHSFCEKASSCVASPFLVLQLIKESIKYFKLSMPAMPNCLLNVHMPSSAAASCTPQAAGTSSGDSQPSAQPAATGVGGAMMSVEQLNAIRSCAAQVRYLLIVQLMYPPSIAELGRHCVEMAYMAAFNKLNHGRFNEADIEDTVELMLRARELFGLVPPSHCRAMFEAYLKFVRKQKACKKEPIQRINGALHTAPMLQFGAVDESSSGF